MIFSRLLTIASADLRARLRRPAMLVFLGLLLAAASTTFPDPRSGQGILSIGGRRAVYTSAALAVATAGLLPFLLGLFGFYAVSNAIALDRRSGMGPLLGASPMRSSEYLLGKLLGSFTLLSVVTLAFAVVVMAVQVVHGEAPLAPLVFLAHLLVVALPALLAVASFALLFECVPFLSGRFGDVAYFFVWVVTMSMPVFLGGPDTGLYPAYAAALDWNGLAFLITEIRRVTGSGSMAIGWGAAPQTGAAVVFPGFDFSAEMLGKRALAFLPPLALLPVALLAFDRFDPARRLASASTKASLVSWLSALLRPAAARLLEVVIPAERSATRAGLLSAALTDLLVTLRLSPLLVIGIPSAALVALLVPPATAASLLSAAFVLLALLLADVGTREERTGLGRVFAATPGAGGRLTAVKLLSAAATALLLLGPFAAKASVAHPLALPSAVAGAFFAAALAVVIGQATGSPKPFVGLLLALWYVAMSDKGRTAALDLAGFSGAATPGSIGGWLAVAALLAAGALLLERFRLSRA
ncbi:MAG TPA: hypothetical protein VE129_09340 [Thermoanaerobaculia bacterium]|nr:hypothetical protein [Thermoanaerobaculia bacterium]